MRLKGLRPRVCHLLAAVAVLAILMSVTALPLRWKYHQRRIQGLAFMEQMDLGQADFLVYDVPKLRDRPNIASEDAWLHYMNERVAERRYLDLHMNAQDWADAFARGDRENRTKAVELRVLAAQAAKQRRNSWWHFWEPGQPLGAPTRAPGR
jgi:hypothetical protein